MCLWAFCVLTLIISKLKIKTSKGKTRNRGKVVIVQTMHEFLIHFKQKNIYLSQLGPSISALQYFKLHLITQWYSFFFIIFFYLLTISWTNCLVHSLFSLKTLAFREIQNDKVTDWMLEWNNDLFELSPCITQACNFLSQHLL